MVGKNPPRLKVGSSDLIPEADSDSHPVIVGPKEDKSTPWPEIHRPGVVIKSTASNRESE